jgi:Mn2+/Fe2+ NRAMP family transporter
LNGLILPVGLGAMLVASRRSQLLNGYRHPVGLTAAGGVVALAMAALGIYTLVTQIPALLR